MSAPGYPLSRLLRELPEGRLDYLLGGSHRLAEALLQAQLSIDEKVKFILHLRGGEDLIREPSAVQMLVGHLPAAKQRELQGKVGQLSDLSTLTARQERDIASFFGVAEERRLSRTAGHASLDEIAPVYGLFPHQREALTRLDELLQGPDRRAILHMPTGAGKTRTAMHLVARHFQRSEPAVVVWLAHSYELLEQAAEDFEVAWRSLGSRSLTIYRFWGSGDVDLSGETDALVVAGLAKMNLWSRDNIDRFLRLADRTSLTVMDEAHQSIATTYRQVLEALSTKRYNAKLVGLTATPGRTWCDVEADRELAAFFKGNKVSLSVEGYDNPVEYLMDEGYLARPKFHTLNAGAGLDLTDHDRRRLAESLDIPPDLLQQMGESEERNLAVIQGVEQLLSEHSRVLVFAATVDHAKLITATLSLKGYEAYCITGETPKPQRAHWIKRFRSNVGRPLVLVNFGVLTTGFDAPRASAALIARPTKSLVLFSQMVGRVIRGPKAGGNATCEIVTVVDPRLPGFGSIAEAFTNWEDVWE